MAYKVLIPTAGTGSRLGGITKHINKSLVSIGGKPAISHIIEHFPSDTQFVVATGYKGELVKEYLSLAYPDKDIQFVDVLLYDGEGSGLGLSVLSCKKYLQEPFVFCACDTIVTEEIPAPDYDWMGYDHREALNRYRKIRLDENGTVVSIDEKDAPYGEISEPYIGLAGIHDYTKFWEIMESGKEKAIAEGEAYGLRGLLDHPLIGKKFTWFDIGVTVELEATRKRFEKPNAPNILEKENESIWFLDHRVIKFSTDVSFISGRVKRAKLLDGFIPKIIGNTTHMYCYDYVNGTVLSKCISRPLFNDFLEFSRSFWKTKELDGENLKKFKETCMNFYKEKTFQRVRMFYVNHKKKDNAKFINHEEYPALEELLNSVDWEWLSSGLPGQFHGDYHFENIVYDEKCGTFKFLDWRQGFGKLFEIGDVYYDLAKLNHGLIISHELIAKELFKVNWTDDTITFDFARKESLVNCENCFYAWLGKNGYDVKKVKALTAIIFLNIAALHEYHYGLMLYGLGKQMLYRSLNDDE